MTVISFLHRTLSALSPSRRELARWRRRSECEAIRAAERIETARLLAGMASCQLRLADLDRGDSSSHPRLEDYHEQLNAALTRLYRGELYRYWEQMEEER